MTGLTHKERGLAPFLRKPMDHFPMWYGGAAETSENIRKVLGAASGEEAFYSILGLDYKAIHPRYIGPKLERFEDGTWMNEWGVKRGGVHYGMALTHPLNGAETTADIEAYKGGPDPSYYDVVISEEQKAWAKDYCLIGAYWSPIFHDAEELIGMEDFFIAMYENEKLVRAILEKCFAFYYELDRKTFEANPGVIDMYMISNDFGSQRSLLMSPEMWRKFFKPYIAKLMAQAKKYGCVTALHSCGDIHEIIGDLIEIGVDAINPIQVGAENMDPVKLVETFKDQCVFFGGIDENRLLKYGTVQQVKDETRRIIDTLGKYGGTLWPQATTACCPRSRRKTSSPCTTKAEIIFTKEKDYGKTDEYAGTGTALPAQKLRRKIQQ
jgi:uroporphyrinogen decarboxylase